MRDLFRGRLHNLSRKEDVELAETAQLCGGKAVVGALWMLAASQPRSCWDYFPSVSQTFTPHGYINSWDKVNKLQWQQSVVE